MQSSNHLPNRFAQLHRIQGHCLKLGHHREFQFHRTIANLCPHNLKFVFEKFTKVRLLAHRFGPTHHVERLFDQ